MNSYNHQLTVTRGPEPGRVIGLSSINMTIGRDPMTEITINDPEVSRRHATLSATSTGYELQDLGSTNGTFVDGIRLGGEPVALQAGQVITIGGGVELVYEAVAEVDAQAETVLETDIDLPELPESPEPPGPSESVDAGDSLEPFEPTAEGTVLDEGTLADANLPDEDETTPSDAEMNGSDVADAEPYPAWSPPAMEEELTSAEETPFEDSAFAEPEEPDPASSYDAGDYAKPVVIPHEGEEETVSEEERPPFYRRASTIIAALLLLILCCCCSFLLFFYYVGGDWLLRQMGLQ